jgi:hypothetical protein
LQDILGKSVELQGRYLMMRPTSVNFPEKSGFLNHHAGLNDFYRVLRALRPIEMLFNSKIGSSISYKQNGSSVEVERSLKLDSFPESFQAEQEELLDLFEDASAHIRQNLLTLDECSFLGVQGLSDFVSKPKPALVRDYLNCFHDESYGLGIEVHPGDAKVRIRDLAFIIHGDSTALKRIYWQVGWPEALAKSSLGFIPGKSIMRLASKFIWKRE